MLIKLLALLPPTMLSARFLFIKLPLLIKLKDHKLVTSLLFQSPKIKPLNTALVMPPSQLKDSRKSNQKKSINVLFTSRSSF